MAKILKAQQPDPFIGINKGDMTPAKFGHLNYILSLLGNIEGSGADVTNLATSTNITAVPGSLADVADVQTYLATAVPIIETRLDNIESKVNSLLTSLRNAGLIA